MTGGPAPTPNSPVSKHTIWFYCAAGTDGNLLQSKAVELWAARLIGLLFHFSPFLSVCLSATSIFKFSRSSTTPRPPPSTHLPSPLYNQPSSRLICVVEVSLAGGTLLFSVLKRSQFDFCDLDVSVRACAGSVYITCPNEREYYCFVKLYKGEEIPHSCFFLSSFVAW